MAPIFSPCFIQCHMASDEITGAIWLRAIYLPLLESLLHVYPLDHNWDVFINQIFPLEAESGGELKLWHKKVTERALLVTNASRNELWISNPPS